MLAQGCREDGDILTANESTGQDVSCVKCQNMVHSSLQCNSSNSINNMALENERSFQITSKIRGDPSTLGYDCDQNSLNASSEPGGKSSSGFLTAMLKRAKVEAFAN